jgi:hypothetical protein
VRVIGVVGGDFLRIDRALQLSLSELADAHGALQELFA